MGSEKPPYLRVARAMTHWLGAQNPGPCQHAKGDSGLRCRQPRHHQPPLSIPLWHQPPWYSFWGPLGPSVKPFPLSLHSLLSQPRQAPQGTTYIFSWQPFPAGGPHGTRLSLDGKAETKGLLLERKMQNARVSERQWRGGQEEVHRPAPHRVQAPCWGLQCSKARASPAPCAPL